MTYPGGVRTVSLSRRGALLLPVILGTTGCTFSVDSDPYIAAMAKDPMYAWNPPMSVKRHVSTLPRDAPLERVPFSVIDIWLTPADAQSVPALFDDATQARADAGYSESDRRHVGKIGQDECWIACSITESTYSPDVPQTSGKSEHVSIHIKLAAPYLEP